MHQQNSRIFSNQNHIDMPNGRKTGSQQVNHSLTGQRNRILAYNRTTPHKHFKLVPEHDHDLTQGPPSTLTVNQDINNVSGYKQKQHIRIFHSCSKNIWIFSRNKHEIKGKSLLSLLLFQLFALSYCIYCYLIKLFQSGNS